MTELSDIEPDYNIHQQKVDTYYKVSADLTRLKASIGKG